MTIADAAKKWEITEQRVGALLRSGRIPGAQNQGSRFWSIPDDAVKPEAFKRGPKGPWKNKNAEKGN